MSAASEFVNDWTGGSAMELPRAVHEHERLVLRAQEALLVALQILPIIVLQLFATALMALPLAALLHPLFASK